MSTSDPIHPIVLNPAAIGDPDQTPIVQLPPALARRIRQETAQRTMDDHAATVRSALIEATAEHAADHALRVVVATNLIPETIWALRGELGAGADAPVEKFLFSMMAIALGFADQPLPGLMSHRLSEHGFGAAVRSAFDVAAGVVRPEPTKVDDGDTVYAQFFDEQGCGPNIVILEPEVIDFPREADGSLAIERKVGIGVRMSPDEAGYPSYVTPGGFSTDVASMERLIAKLRAAIDQPRAPRLDAATVPS